MLAAFTYDDEWSLLVSLNACLCSLMDVFGCLGKDSISHPFRSTVVSIDPILHYILKISKAAIQLFSKTNHTDLSIETCFDLELTDILLRLALYVT